MSEENSNYLSVAHNSLRIHNRESRNAMQECLESSNTTAPTCWHIHILAISPRIVYFHLHFFTPAFNFATSASTPTSTSLCNPL